MTTITRNTNATIIKHDVWLTSYIIDHLYLEMCEGPPVKDSHDEGCKYSGQILNFHYLEAINYARRMSLGNFEGLNAKDKPRFIVNAVNFTPMLKHELKLVHEKKYLDRIITDAVFRIFKARHRMIFYEHIEANKLIWRIINL